MPNFIEKNCKIEHEGKTFESGGSFIADCSDGFRRGVVYANPDKRVVTTWHGEPIAHAEYGRIYQGNFCKMQSVKFTYEGTLFIGRYCPDWSQMVRVRSTKRIPKVA
jgi:hypothetical protein